MLSISLSLSLSNLTPKLKISDIAIELRVACLSLLPHAPNLPHAAAPTTNRTAQRWKRVAGPTTNQTALRWRSNELVHVDAISVLSDGILTMEGENEWFLSMLESNGVVILILTLLTLILLRFLFVIHRTGKRLRPTSAKPLSTLIVLGSGGHTAEMLNLLAALQKDRFYPRYYIAAATDNMSLLKAQTFESCSDDEMGKDKAEYMQIYWSREVGQSYITFVGATLDAIAHALWLIIKVRPQVILCNGPGTCIPICAIAFFKVLGIRWSSIFYEESIARVKRLSLSGLLLYKLKMAEQLYVQWPQLQRQYPQSIYVGCLM